MRDGFGTFRRAAAGEAEITAVRIIMAGRMAGLDGETIRSRLRATYV